MAAVAAVAVVAEVEEEEAEAEAAEGYQQERHLLAEPHPFMESWEETPRLNSTEIGRKAVLFSSHSLFIEE